MLEQFWSNFLEMYVSSKMLIFRCWEFIGIIVMIGIHISDEDVKGIIKGTLIGFLTIICLILGYCNILPMWILIPADIMLILHLSLTLPLTILFFVLICGAVIESFKKIKKYFKRY